jgi:hypothetical protein
MKTTQSTLRGRSMFRAERIPKPFQNNGTIETWPGGKKSLNSLLPYDVDTHLHSKLK